MSLKLSLLKLSSISRVDRLRTTLLRTVVVFAAIASFANAQDAPPVRLIFDTDIGNDVDDVLAMGVIHALQSRGECELLAVTITKDHPAAAAFVDCVIRFTAVVRFQSASVETAVSPQMKVASTHLQISRITIHFVIRTICRVGLRRPPR